jgi:hypothetical protein
LSRLLGIALGAMPGRTERHVAEAHRIAVDRHRAARHRATATRRQLTLRSLNVAVVVHVGSPEAWNTPTS